MALTKGDDYPIHQTSEPIAYAGTDRNFYDRYFFNGYGEEGDDFFAAAFGVYPHLNIADASFCIIRDGVQTSLHASRWLNMERMDLQVGPIRIAASPPTWCSRGARSRSKSRASFVAKARGRSWTIPASPRTAAIPAGSSWMARKPL